MSNFEGVGVSGDEEHTHTHTRELGLHDTRHLALHFTNVHAVFF